MQDFSRKKGKYVGLILILLQSKNYKSFRQDLYVRVDIISDGGAIMIFKCNGMVIFEICQCFFSFFLVFLSLLENF